MTQASSAQMHLLPESAPFNSLPLPDPAVFPWPDTEVCLTAGFEHQARELLQHLLTKREIA